MRAAPAVLAAALLLAGACGGDESTMGRAEAAMAEVKAADMMVELSATSPEVEEPVGFRVEGSFSLEGDGDDALPVFDFTYTDLLAGEDEVATISSDGAVVVVDAGGQRRELTAEDAPSLRLGDDEGFADLGIASWVDGGREDRRGGDTVVTGRVDAADLLSDIARIAAQVTAEGTIPPLDDDAAERLGRLVRSSEIEVVIGPDGVPRSVDAALDFGSEVPDELVDALGPYAAVRLRLQVTLEPRP